MHVPQQHQRRPGQDQKRLRMGRQRSAQGSVSAQESQESVGHHRDLHHSSSHSEQNIWAAEEPSEPPLGPSHLTTNQHLDNYGSSFESLRPGFKQRFIGPQELPQQRRNSHQSSSQHVQKSLQILDNSFEHFLRRSPLISYDGADSISAQQSPHPLQRKSVTFWQCQQRRGSCSTSNESNSSQEACIELPPIRRREIISSLDETVQNVMASMLSDEYSNVQWKHKFHKTDISYFIDEASVESGLTRFCCVTNIHVTVEDFLKLFLVSDPDSMARNNRVLSGSLHESRILADLRQPTPDQPMNSMYVRYVSTQAPGLLAAREMCFTIATEMIRLPDGSTIGFSLWDTVNYPEFAEVINNYEPCAPFRSGFFLQSSGQTQSSSGRSNQASTKIVYVVESEHGGWAPGITARLLMEKFGANLARLCAHFRRKQLDSRTFVMKTEWQSRMSAKSCKRCKKPFQILSHRVNCHACGHVICKACVSKELVELHAVGLVPMPICFNCLKKAGLCIPSL